MLRRSSNPGKATRGITLGLAAALIVAAAHWAGLLSRAELWALDWRFRNLPTIKPGPKIVHVDIDDKALDQIGRWPWPRRRLAQLVGVLTQCGADAVVLDIILPHPQQPRFVRPGQTDLYTADDSALLNPDVPPVPILDDVELAQSLAASANLYLAMHVDLARPETDRQRGQRLQSVISVVATRPAMTRAAVAEEIHLERSEIDQLMATAKERAFDRRVQALLVDRSDRSLPDVLRAMLGSAAAGTEDFDIARRAYLRQRALTEMERFAVDADAVSDAVFPDGKVVPPLVTLAKVMAHTGFVTVVPDDDGIVRRVPMLTRTARGIFPHLALVVAAEALADEHGGTYRLLASGAEVSVVCGDGFTRTIPVDRNGHMLANWCLADPAKHPQRHISAVAAGGIWASEEHRQHNRDLARLACYDIATSLNEDPDPDLIGRHNQVCKDLYRVQFNRYRDLLFTPARAAAEPKDLVRREADLEKQIDQACTKLIKYVDELLSETDTAPAQTDEDKAQAEQIRKIHALRDLIRQVERENDKIDRRLAEARGRLREMIEGKIVLVGSTATGAADFVPTPLHERTPGVVVHGNVLNTILSGRFVAEAHPAASALLVLLVGALIALIASTRGPIESSILLVVAVIGYAMADLSVWAGWTYWMVTAAPIGSMLLVFAVITVYRQLTEQRQRRVITSTFKQYVSPAMVDRLVEDPTRANLGGQRRQLSCLFSDLAGFTSLSERLGAEGTVTVLNRYLDRAGDIIQVRRGGTLSKYEGDGVFAFFGAPIPQPDHAARAIAAALDCQGFLPDFNRALHAEGLLPDNTDLAVRIGITAGEVFVGNMGSTQRIAYTAIGDSVNLAARLETANKFFGTRILVNDEAWQSGADGLLGRPLGRIVVVGKTEPVAVWEPLGRRDDADKATRQQVDDFAAGVEQYAAGDFDGARARFEAIGARANDPAARVYLRLCEVRAADPAEAAAFDGVIHLTEK